jgi:hypothetical protein
MRGELWLGGRVHVVEQCPDFAAYLCGGWLEEYVFMRLEPLLREGKLRDMRIGLEVSWTKKATDTEQLAAQEFDVTVTDGRRLLIVECKAGRVLNGDIYKLENSVRNYGGVEARGMLVAAFAPSPPCMRRLQSAKTLGCLADDKVSSRLAEEVFMALRGAKV